MSVKLRVVTGFDLTFTTPGDNPPVQHRPERVWLIRRSGQPVLGYAVVSRADGAITIIQYDYDARTWSQISQWHLGLTATEVAETYGPTHGREVLAGA